MPIRVLSAEDWQRLEHRAVAYVLNTRFTDAELLALFRAGFNESCFPNGRHLGAELVWRMRDLMNAGADMVEAWAEMARWCITSPEFGPDALTWWMYGAPGADLLPGCAGLPSERDYPTLAALIDTVFPNFERDYRPLIARGRLHAALIS